MRKPESSYIASIHKLLPRELHWEKMNNMYRGGTADVWYSGNKGDLWVEYKYLPKLPKIIPILADLSALQRLWLRGRYIEGRRVAVIIGSPSGGVILERLHWEKSLSPAEFVGQCRTKQELAQWIIGAVSR